MFGKQSRRHRSCSAADSFDASAKARASSVVMAIPPATFSTVRRLVTKSRSPSDEKLSCEQVQRGRVR